MVFSMFRILGASCELVTIPKHSIGLYIVVAVLDSIGISFLLLALAGMISRTYGPHLSSITRWSLLALIRY